MASATLTAGARVHHGLIHKHIHAESEREREREREKRRKKREKRDAHLGSQSANSCSLSLFLRRLGPFLYVFTQLSPDSRPPSSFRLVFLEIQVATILRSRLFLAIDRPRRTGGGDGGRGKGGNVQEESFQIPRHLNIRTNSTPSLRAASN